MDFILKMYIIQIQTVYILEKNYWGFLDKVILVGGNQSQGKTDYDTGGIFHGLLLAPTIKYYSTIFVLLYKNIELSRDSMIVHGF